MLLEPVARRKSHVRARAAESMLLAGGGFNGVMGAGLVAEIKADREEKTLMACRSCGSENQTELGAEINIYKLLRSEDARVVLEKYGFPWK